MTQAFRTGTGRMFCFLCGASVPANCAARRYRLRCVGHCALSIPSSSNVRSRLRHHGGACGCCRKPGSSTSSADCVEHAEMACEDRKSVVEGKGVSGRVDIGGSRIIKKKTNTS